MRPRIGITSGTGGSAWAPGGSSWDPYAMSVAAAGGEPVHLGPDTQGREAEVVAGLHGILFSGGYDIDLTYYPNPPDLHGEPAEAVMSRFRMEPEPARDAYELPLLAEALERDLPVLGICRGCQLLGVGLGGRLILDIPSEVQTRLRHAATAPPESQSGRHALQIFPETLLGAVLPPAQYRECNSRHHQAVRPDLPDTVRVAAVSPEDGIIEAIEVPSRRWVFGVQWHPEHRRDTEIRELYVPLFGAFLEAAR